jgi:hypothetical protein
MTFLIALVAAVWSLFLMPYQAQSRAIASLKEVGARMTIASAEGPQWQRSLVETVLGKDAFVDVLSLDLAETKTDDSFATSIGSLRQLRELNIDRCDITDSATVSISGLTRLNSLSMRYTGISDLTLSRLAKLPSLKQLHLTGTKVTDRGLTYLCNVNSLEQVYVRWTPVTPAGADALKKAIPGCEIHSHLLATMQATR